MKAKRRRLAPFLRHTQHIDTRGILTDMQKSTYAIKSDALILDRSWSGDYVYTIHDLPADEKPREKLLAHGPEALTVQELTVLLLITGTTRENILDMTNRVIRDYGERNVFAERDAQKLAADLDIDEMPAGGFGTIGSDFVGPVGFQHHQRRRIAAQDLGDTQPRGGGQVMAGDAGDDLMSFRAPGPGMGWPEQAERQKESNPTAHSLI